jgi:predicted glutamine amidotransferase
LCRFLIFSSKQETDISAILNSFATACEKSLAPDGERQGDGFGIAYKTGGTWQLQKSTSSIWEGRNIFNKLPKTKMVMAHARSATFSLGKDNLDYNQPFTDGQLGFVFNGTIKKMKTALKLEGEIGSQKLFSLIKLFYAKNPEVNVLERIRDFVLRKAENIEGMNIGLVDKDNIEVLCQYSSNKEYFTIHYQENDDFIFISSEKFGDYDWSDLEKGEVKKFRVK